MLEFILIAFGYTGLVLVIGWLIVTIDWSDGSW